MAQELDKKKIHEFVQRWTGKGYEKGQSQIFWTELLMDVLGVETPSDIITFEEQVKLDHTSFIDAYIPTTHVMIEQKSIGKDLREAIKQSDGTLLTPFQQAKRYASELPYSQRPRWIVTSNFQSFLIYDMEQPQGEPFEILLANLEKEAYMLQFLVEEKDANLKHEMEVSIQAGEIVGRLYDAFLLQYGGEATKDDLHSLNVLCVRLVFCLYAEDAGIFGKDQFVQYLQTFRPENMRMALIDLFKVLDTPVESRSRFLEDKLKAFPYVNGSLFRQQPGEDVPPITEDTASLLIHHASLDFDWSDISPTIFGAVFESTLNPETRRSGGMHYTSIENIHKVIDPLFMDDLRSEFSTIKQQPKGKSRLQQLEVFQQKLASLKFLDPACGSGNFLTETYVSLRRLENEVIEEQTGGDRLLGFEELNPIRVSIQQFYGIEINDFAVTVAKTALWIAEAQMMEETERIISFNNDYLPLKAYDNIREGNALRIDWAEVIPPCDLNYIIGNPPFVGARLMNAEQKQDILDIFGSKWKNAGNLDYVACWYKKASDLITGTNIRCALVSTNSICQGESVANLWKPLFQDGVHIDFAYRTFRWDSESNQKAHVHCVIVSFSKGPIVEAVKNVQEMRSQSNRAGTRKMADYPMLFGEIRQSENDYLLVPRHSTEKRSYIPLGYMSSDVICGDANMMIPDATLYHFGVMESNVHMAWMRAVCGRIKSDYRYSKDIVYNNFPWPTPTEEQKQRIEHTAQTILDARALYPDSSLADLYDPVLMPPELLKAHRENDRAVMSAYGFPIKGFTESDCVAELFKLYKEMTEK